MADEPIIVMGGGLATASFVASYRENGGEAMIVVVSADDEVPYHRPPLSKGLLRGEVEPAQVLVQPKEFYDDNVVELRLATRVEAVDVDARELTLAGDERLGYGTLVVATGARPRPLEVEGADRVGVNYFRTLADALSVRDAAAEGQSALVVGGSFIGSEVAASLRRRGLEVTLVELGDVLMPALRCPALSEQLEARFRAEGVRVMLGTELEELEGHGRLLTGATTTGGEHIEAFLAVVGVGVLPNTEVLRDTGLTIDNGVVVDERFRASVEGVYAIGDVASFPSPQTGRTHRIEHWSSAKAQGEQLGRILTGKRAAYDELPLFFTEVFGLKLQVIGDLDGDVDQCVIRGSVDEGRLAGFHLAGGTLVGAVLAGQAADFVDEVSTLVRERPTIEDPERLADDSLRPAAIAGT